MDSGIGGTWTLEKIKQLLPNENYIFFMDKFNAPYGNKTRRKLKQLAFHHIKKITSIFDVKLVVLACNTLSSVAYEFLKQKFVNLPIIKIEPYILPRNFENENTLILATKNTIKFNKNLNRYNSCSNIYLKGFGNLAKKIDNASGNYNQIQKYLTKQLAFYKRRNIKNVVLGCTHFNFIKQQIKTALGDDIKFFENSDVVAKNVKNVLSKLSLLQKTNKQGQTLFLYK